MTTSWETDQPHSGSGDYLGPPSFDQKLCMCLIPVVLIAVGVLAWSNPEAIDGIAMVAGLLIGCLFMGAVD